MQNPHYALVAYVRHPVGEFVENVRKELHPELPLTPAHLTILPPRCRMVFRLIPQCYRSVARDCQAYDLPRFGIDFCHNPLGHRFAAQKITNI